MYNMLFILAFVMQTTFWNAFFENIEAEKSIEIVVVQRKVFLQQDATQRVYNV